MPFGFFGFFHGSCSGHHFPAQASRLQCLSASSGFSTLRNARWADEQAQSPMPFGFFGFFHGVILSAETAAPHPSPMPFGFFGFFHIRTLIVRDMEAKSGLQCLSASSGFSTTSDRKESYRHAAAVSNAFRLLRVFPHQPFN